MLTIVVLMLFAGAVAFDLLPLKKRPKKETVIYCFLLSLSFGVLVLYSLNIVIPGPLEPIHAAVKALFGLE